MLNRSAVKATQALLTSVEYSVRKSNQLNALKWYKFEHLSPNSRYGSIKQYAMAHTRLSLLLDEIV
ncbi:MAG: hypothetical protein ACI8PB_004766 [Desulforhopalus sp.]|jgi:hypothetical protein